MKTEEAIVYVKNDQWVAESKGVVRVVTDQDPYHSVLMKGRHENRRILVETIDGIENKARFIKFID